MKKTCCIRRWPFIALFFGVLFYASTSFAQITINPIDVGPFTPGSTIGAPFSIANGCADQGNQFQLYLSDENGSFATEKLIGSYTGFYSTYVNGILPAASVPGTGYRVRVKSTNPVSVSSVSNAFEIKAGTAVQAQLGSSQLNPANAETFGTCISKADNQFFIENQSTSTSTVTATITDEVNHSSTTLNFPVAIQRFTAQQVHYTIVAKAVMPDGSVGTKAYLLINNKTITAFGTSGNNVVCLPLGQLEFNVDITSAAGIQNNFPGDSYTINWGDNSTSVYTLCEIVALNGKVSHTYTRSSCGSTSVSSAGTIYNAFDVSINVSNAFCGNVGTPVSSSAKVVVKPLNSFSFDTPGCTNANITFTNTSVLGENPNTNTPGCVPNVVTYNWFVDGVPVKVNQPRSYNLVYPFTTHGEHTIRLESNSNGACNADPVEMKICIQDPPKPAFTLTSTTVCTPTILKPTDNSIIDNICNNDATYNWRVSPAVAFVNGTSAASKEPEFNFTAPGIYTIVLNISTASCGFVASAPQTVVVNATPAATLSADITLCNLATYDFNNTTSGPTRTTFSGTSQELADTYTWSITAAAGGTFTFTGGTNANSKYPSIQFNNYDEYTVTVTHKNNCGTVTKTQKLTFSSAPVVNAGPDQTICYNDTQFTLAGSITGTTTSQSWIGGAGIFTPNRNTLNAVYTPTAAEKTAGSVNLRLRAITGLSGVCAQVDDEVVLKIQPDISIKSAPSKIICTGNTVAYTPTTSVTGVTFTWTATGSTNAAGYSASGTGDITEVITNTDATADATVTYIITSHKDGCDGTPFTFTVTITPNPTASAAAPNLTICNKNSAGITLSSNLTGARFTYTSSITGSITGNSNRNTASAGTQINDVLTNSGTTAGSVTYTITPFSAGGCPGTPTTITITVLPSATLANAGADEAICNASTYPLNGNAAVVGAGKWTIVTAPTAITFADDTQNNTQISGLVPGNTYTLRWTIADAGCSNSSDDVQITVNPLSVGGTTTGDVAVCAGANGGNISLAGEVGNIIRWEKSIDNGTTWATIVSTANPYVFSNLTVSTQFRAVVQSGACAEAFSSVSTVTVNPGTVVANAGSDQSLCSGSGISLSGNNPAPNTGLWTLVSAQTGVVITDATLYNTTITGLVPGQTYTFRWTISGFASCPPSFDEVTITYYSPVTNNISAAGAPSCAGQNVTITGDVPTGGTGTFAYQWQSSPDGTTWSNVVSATNKDLTLVVTAPAFFRRLVNSTICTSTSNAVQVTVLPGLANNQISADQTICLGAAVSQLVGTPPTGGNGTFSFQWQASTNATVWTDILGATSANYTPPIPMATVYYRRLVSSGPCASNISNPVKITVNPPAKAELVFVADKGCAPFRLAATNISATPYPDRNAVYTWFANNVQIGTGITFPGYTIATDNESVVIKLVVTSSLGCNSDETSHIFSTQQNVTAAYAQNVTAGCGPLNVAFTNISNSLTAATFKWNFGNGTTSNLAQPPAITYQADPTGKDITYTITLEATTPCGITSQTSTVLVKGKPVSVFSPDKTTGCSPLAVTFSNTSPGNYTSYTYDFGDGTPSLTVTDKNSVSHTYTTLAVRDYIVKMTATNECGTNESQYSIRVSPNDITPELVVNSNQLRGCAPLKVDFFNNTKGASTFVYDFGDGSTTVTHAAPETVSHTFTQPGKYTITLYASNSCSNASTTETVEVLAQPTVSFSADKTVGCDGVTVKFKNTSSGAIGYVWDFGDGTPTSNAIEPTHIFNGPGKNYSVTLTATNTLGCTNSVTLNEYINIALPPTPSFAVSPGNELSIPNYTFGFKDTSVGAVSWEWDFGDGAKSTLQNPSHTYANEGVYNVTLKVLNKEGCPATVFQSVRIIGVPGYLNLPNSFMPASAKNEIKNFKAKGRGIKEWDMKVFNKWGQVLWETSKLDDGSPQEGWDGTYNGQEQPQGVYYWKIEVKFINGSDWKGVSLDSSPPRKTGVIYLIR